MVNTKNLIQINKTEKNNSNNIRIATMNTRSVKNKQLQIIEIVELQNIDFHHANRNLAKGHRRRQSMGKH